MRVGRIGKGRARGNTWGTSCRETLSDSRRTRFANRVLHALIVHLTLSDACSRLKGVRKGSRVLGEASRKAGKWPLQACIRVFAAALGGKKGAGWPIETRTRLLRQPSGSLEGFRVSATEVPVAS